MSEPRRREPVIAIDGPAGTGKSTISARLAEHFGYVVLDTGAIYRAVALAASREGIDPADGPALGALAETLDIRFENRAGENLVLLAGEDVSREIRLPAIGRSASTVATHPEVRRALLDLQRRLGAEGGVVAEGRDIGTVVFPDAPVKFYLTATAEERARRRVLQLEEAGIEADFSRILQEQIERDEQDTNRSVAPLRRAEDAILIDSTDIGITEVVRTMIAHVDAVRSEL